MSRNAWISLAIAVLVLLTGLIWTARTYRHNRAWSEGEARVLANSINTFQTSAVKMFRPEASFRYLVNGEPHVVPYSFPSAFTTEQQAREFANRYAPQSRYLVLYDPANHDRIVLDSSDLSTNLRFPIALLGGGVLMSGISLVMIVKANRAVCPKCATPVELWDKFCWSCAAKLPKRRKRVHKLIS